MKALDTITNLKFDSPNDILNYFEKHKIPLALVFLLATPPGPSVGIYKMKIG